MKTLEQTPASGDTHWSTRGMAKATGLSQSSISRIWRAFGLKPHLVDRKLRRSAHHSVAELEADVLAWIPAWNDDPKPFVWTKTADQILDSLANYCHKLTALNNDSAH